MLYKFLYLFYFYSYNLNIFIYSYYIYIIFCVIFIIIRFIGQCYKLCSSGTEKQSKYELVFQAVPAKRIRVEGPKLPIKTNINYLLKLPY